MSRKAATLEPRLLSREEAANVPDEYTAAVARVLYDLEPFYMPIGRRVNGVEMAGRLSFDDAPAYRQNIAIKAAEAAIAALQSRGWSRRKRAEIA